MIMYRSRTTIQSWTQVGATQSCGGASTCSISVTWTPSASDVGDWYFVVDVFGAGGQCSSNPFYLPNLPAPWISCGSTGYVGTTISLPNCDQGPGNCTGACTSTTACYETDPGNGTQGGCSFTTYSGGGSCTPIPTTQTKSCTLTPNCPPPDNYCNGGTCVALTTAATTACGSGTARSTGLVSTPQTGPNGQGTKFNTTGACAIDPAKIPFAPYKLPSYDDLKSLYFDQAKESITIKKQIDTGNMGEGGLSSYLSGGKNLIYIKGYLSMNNNIGGSNTAVVFIDGDLYFSSPMTQFTYGNAGSGIVFIVKGNVNIDQSVNRIDAVIISAGKIYTAGANCSHNPPLVTTNQLVINGSLVSLNENNTIEFCRTLANNSTAPAERINQQPKYLVILRNLYSDTIQKWSEIQ